MTLNTLLSKSDPTRRLKIIAREAVIALAILMLFVFAGSRILHALGLQPYTLGISGGIVLFMIALGMVFPARRVIDDQGMEDPLVVPIAMPLIAGPGAISTVILLAQNNPVREVAVGVAVQMVLDGIAGYLAERT